MEAVSLPVEGHYAFIQRILREVASGAVDTALEGLLEEAVGHFGAVQVALWTVSESPPSVTLINAVPKSDDYERLPSEALIELVSQVGTSERAHIQQMGDLFAWLSSFLLQPYNAMYIVSVLRTTPFTECDESLLSAWFLLVKLSVERLQAQLHLQQAQRYSDRRLREVTALYEIGQAMDTGDLQALLDMITRKATEVMEAHACSLMLRDEDDHTLVIRSSYGLPETIIMEARVPWGEGIAGRVAASGEAMLITDPRMEPRLKGEDVTYRPDISASLCVPLRDGHGLVVGVLNIHRRKPAPVFDQQHLRLFSIFAMQAAAAIKNARLYHDLTHRLNELSVLSSLSAAVNSTLDLEAILQQTADGIVETVQFDRCAIFLLDKSGRLLNPRAVRGYNPQTIGRTSVRVADGVIGMVVRTKIPFVETNAQKSSQPMRGFGRMLGTDAFLVAPILARDRVIGVVVADNKPSKRSIDRANIQLLSTFINQAGMAIENARLYEDLDRRFKELHDLWEYTRNLLSSIGVGVMSIDRDETVLTWNEAAERITSVTQSAALGHKLEDLLAHFFLPEDEKETLLSIIRAPFRTGERDSRFKCVLHPYQRGEMYFNFESSPLRAPNGSVQGVVFVFEDITRQVRMEKEVQRVGQLATVGLLASTIAHEVRNPLSSIRVTAQYLLSEYALHSQAEEFLNMIIAEVDSLDAKIREFLKFARPTEPVFQDVDLTQLVNNTLQFMHQYLDEHNVRLHVQVSVPFTIKADPAQLKEVLRNLVINAVQSMSEGGDLYIEAAPAPGDVVRLIVRDTGTGIPATDLERIFTPFYTTKSEGTGLGLANVQKIVESHGGSIEVQSEVGVGTEMRITLPVRPVRRLPRMEVRESANLRNNPPDL